MHINGPVLSSENIKNIHNDSIKVLEDIGVKVPSEKVLALVENAGGKVDWDKKTACFSSSMIGTALASCPKTFVLGARNPQYDLSLPTMGSVLNMDGCGTNTLDFNTGKRRTAVLKDLQDVARVFEEIPSAYVLWSSVSPSDVSGGAKGIVASATSLLNCSKHLQDEIQRAEEVPYIVEICKAILGSEEAMRERKIYSATYCTVAPLCHDGEMLEGTIELSKYHAPILVYPMPACGSTGPGSLYSNVVQANAEALSAIALFQIATPRTPIIFGGAIGRIDLNSGAFLEGAVETGLMLAAMTQMGKHYGLPTTIAGCLTDANSPGMQAVMEKQLTMLPLILNDVDVIQGIGLLESSMTMSLEQMLIDEEIFNICSRLKSGIDMSQDKFYFDDIQQVGHGGHFLKRPNTRKNFRSDEFYTTKLIDRNPFAQWVKNGQPDMFSLAHQKVEKILAQEPKCPLDMAVQKQIMEIVDEAKRRL